MITVSLWAHEVLLGKRRSWKTKLNLDTADDRLGRKLVSTSNQAGFLSKSRGNGQ